MADNFPQTPGSGRNVATDEVSYSGDTADVQLIRPVLTSGSEGSRTVVALPGDATLGLYVAPRKDLARVAVTSSGLTTSVTSYTAGDQVGAQFEVANAGRYSGGGGRIVGVVLVSAADTIGAYDVVFTDSSITLASDNAAYSISDADALKVVALVQLAGAFDIGGNRVAQAYNLSVPYVCSGGTSLYAGLITRTAHTFFAAAGDLQLVVYVERD